MAMGPFRGAIKGIFSTDHLTLSSQGILEGEHLIGCFGGMFDMHPLKASSERIVQIGLLTSPPTGSFGWIFQKETV